MTPEADAARRFLEDAGVTLPCLLDRDRAVYTSYDRDVLGETYAPYPVHVVVDGDGAIRHLSDASDPAEVRAVIDALLAEME